MDPSISKGVALITGAGSGIGRAIALNFARMTCRKLFLVDLSANSLQETKQIIVGEEKTVEIELHVADISSPEAVSDMVATCVSRFGRVDFGINNAGIALGGVKTADTSLSVFDKSCTVNEKGNFLCQKYEILQMIEQEPLDVFDKSSFKDRNVRGVIVNTASLCGLIILRDFAAYTSSKHAVTSMTKQIAREYAPFKIRVNSVCPGIVYTPGVTASGITESFKAGLQKQAPMNRFIHAEEVADAVVFLCSSRASAVTGVNLSVDGGAALYHQP